VGRSLPLQRTGVGKLLFGEAEQMARNHPARTLRCKVVDVRPEMTEYYIKRGMREVGRTPFVAPQRVRPGFDIHFIELAKHYD